MKMMRCCLGIGIIVFCSRVVSDRLALTRMAAASRSFAPFPSEAQQTMMDGFPFAPPAEGILWLVLRWFLYLLWSAKSNFSGSWFDNLEDVGSLSGISWGDLGYVLDRMMCSLLGES